MTRTRVSITIALALLLVGCAPDPPTPAAAEDEASGAPPPASAMAVPEAIRVDGVPPVPRDIVEDLARYRNSRSAALLGWSDDGVLVATRFANTTQLHHVATPGGMRRQLTFFEEPVGSALPRPDSERGGLVYLRDIGGSEFYQLFWLDERGESRLLSDGRSRYTGVAWSPSGRWLGYATTERNGRDWDLHILPVDADGAPGAARIVQESDETGWLIEDWSADETRLLVSRYISVNESRLYEIDLASGERRRLLADTTGAFGDARYGQGPEAGESVYFTSDLDSEYLRLRRLDPSGAVATLTSDLSWSVESFAVSRQRSTLAYDVNEDGFCRLYLLDLASGEALPAPELPRGLVGGLRFDPSGERLGFTLSSAAAPADVFSIRLGGGDLVRWTRSELGGMQASALVEPGLVRYRTFDDRQIPAFVYRPAGPGPHPVIINIHGGPESQARPRFSPITQYYVARLGTAVIYPNVRGSAGYGKTYLKLDNGRLREDSVRDIGALLDWIGTQSDLDSDRVAVMGGSYGGYMVLASLVSYGDRLRAGVERVGIANFVTFLTNTQPYRQDLRRVEYGDERDPSMREFLESISPLNHVDKLTTPLMISQGLNDPRVPASESEQMVAALDAAGVPAWYVLAEDEGHGFARKANQDYNAAVTALFLRRHLLGEDE